MYATVADAAKDYCLRTRKELFQVVVKPIIPGVTTNLHLSFTNPSRDNLIMEYVKGKLMC